MLRIRAFGVTGLVAAACFVFTTGCYEESGSVAPTPQAQTPSADSPAPQPSATSGYGRARDSTTAGGRGSLGEAKRTAENIVDQAEQQSENLAEQIDEMSEDE